MKSLFLNFKVIERSRGRLHPIARKTGAQVGTPAAAVHNIFSPPQTPLSAVTRFPDDPILKLHSTRIVLYSILFFPCCLATYMAPSQVRIMSEAVARGTSKVTA